MLFANCKKKEEIIPYEKPKEGKSNVVFNSSKVYGTMNDQEGHVYKTIVIGSQTWMAENLRTTRFRNGLPIHIVTGGYSDWSSLTHSALCIYANSTLNDSSITYGFHYNWYALNDTSNIAPEGWRVPTEQDWEILKAYLGGQSVAGGKLKETGTLHWYSPNTGTNESGFSAIPNGFRVGDLDILGSTGSWWTITENSFDDRMAIVYSISNNTSELVNGAFTKNDECAVRLIREY